MSTEPVAGSLMGAPSMWPTPLDTTAVVDTLGTVGGGEATPIIRSAMPVKLQGIHKDLFLSTMEIFLYGWKSYAHVVCTASCSTSLAFRMIRRKRGPTFLGPEEKSKIR